jgi:hypothetical protein
MVDGRMKAVERSPRLGPDVADGQGEAAPPGLVRAAKHPFLGRTGQADQGGAAFSPRLTGTPCMR